MAIIVIGLSQIIYSITILMHCLSPLCHYSLIFARGKNSQASLDQVFPLISLSTRGQWKRAVSLRTAQLADVLCRALCKVQKQSQRGQLVS